MSKLWPYETYTHLLFHIYVQLKLRAPETYAHIFNLRPSDINFMVTYNYYHLRFMSTSPNYYHLIYYDHLQLRPPKIHGHLSKTITIWYLCSPETTTTWIPRQPSVYDHLKFKPTSIKLLWREIWIFDCLRIVNVHTTSICLFLNKKV